MPDCENLATCAFFRTYQNEPGLEVALKGFISLYCKGDRQDDCVRKKVSKALGGPQNVPANMMPNGTPLTGTTRDGWSNEVLEVLNVRATP